MTIKKASRVLVAALTAAVAGSFALGGDPAQASSADKYKTTQAPPSVDGHCRATSGKNAGAVGKYTSDRSGKFWCEGTNKMGDHFRSECGGTPNKCESVSPAS